MSDSEASSDGGRGSPVSSDASDASSSRSPKELELDDETQWLRLGRVPVAAFQLGATMFYALGMYFSDLVHVGPLGDVRVQAGLFEAETADGYACNFVLDGCKACAVDSLADFEKADCADLRAAAMLGMPFFALAGLTLFIGLILLCQFTRVPMALLPYFQYVAGWFILAGLVVWNGVVSGASGAEVSLGGTIRFFLAAIVLLWMSPLLGYVCHAYPYPVDSSLNPHQKKSRIRRRQQLTMNLSLLFVVALGLQATAVGLSEWSTGPGGALGELDSRLRASSSCALVTGGCKASIASFEASRFAAGLAIYGSLSLTAVELLATLLTFYLGEWRARKTVDNMLLTNIVLAYAAPVSWFIGHNNHLVSAFDLGPSFYIAGVAALVLSVAKLVLVSYRPWIKLNGAPREPYYHSQHIRHRRLLRGLIDDDGNGEPWEDDDGDWLDLFPFRRAAVGPTPGNVGGSDPRTHWDMLGRSIPRSEGGYSTERVVSMWQALRVESADYDSYRDDVARTRDRLREMGLMRVDPPE